MARRSIPQFSRRRGKSSSTRSLAWSALQFEPTLAAGVPQHAIVLNSADLGATMDQTLFRIVGDIGFHPTVLGPTIFSFGVYLSNQDSGGTAHVDFDPSLVQDLAVDQWLYAGQIFADVIALGGGAPSVGVGFDAMSNRHVDIKVKRIISSNQTITFVFEASAAGAGHMNLRILSKVTGTR